jgi:hypothetical protein
MHHIHVVIRNMVLQNSIRPEPESYRKIFRQVKPVVRRNSLQF